MFMMGDLPTGQIVPFFFPAYDSNGASVTITGLAVTDIEIYKGTSMTQRSSDNGYALIDTDGIDLDSTTGIHGFSVDMSDNSDAGFYAAGNFYNLVVNAITIDSQTVRFIFQFSLGFNLRPATAGRALVVDSAGLADANVVKMGPTGSGTAQTARDIGASVLLSSGTGSGQLDFTSGVVKSNVTQFNGVAAVSASGRPEVNVSHFGGSAGTFSGGRPEVNTSYWAGGVISSGVSGVPIVDVRYFNGLAGAFASGRPEVNLNPSHGAITFASITSTGAFTISDGLIVTCSTTNRSAIQATGNGSGDAMQLTAGPTGRVITGTAGSTSGDGIYIITTNGHAFRLKADGTDKYGFYVASDIDGNAVVFESNLNGSAASLVDRGHGLGIFSADGITNGNAILLRALYHGCGIFAKAADNEAAFHLQGGSTGPAIRIWPGTGGLGTAAGIEIVGGPNGPAIFARGGYTGNGGSRTQGCSAISIINQSTISGSSGVDISAAMGPALNIYAYGAGSKAVNIYSLYSHGVNIDTNGASSHGVNISGGNSGTSDGVRINAGTGGVGLRLGSFTITGATTLASCTVTGALSIGTLSATTNSLPWNAAWDAEVQSEAQDAIDASGLMNAAATRNALGLASANLDTQLDNLPTNSELSTALAAADDATLAAISDVATAVAAGNTALGAIATAIAGIAVDTTALTSRITSTLFSGITSMAQWLGLLAGKQTGNTTARTEIRATGAGAGTFLETTDSLEAIRDQGDAAWVTGSGGGGGLGSGARTVTLTIQRSDTNAVLEGARVRVIKGAENYVGSTNVSGVIVFNLDDGTWTVSISLAGFSYAGTNLLVDGTESVTYQMTPVVIAPSTIGQTTGYATTFNHAGVAEAGIVVTCQLLSLDSDITGIIGDSAVRTSTSDSNGLVQFTNLFLGAEYEFKRRVDDETDATGFIHTIPTDAGATYELPPIIGTP